ncbi:MAG: VOC family protein [Bacteroidota bacterium]
MKFVHTNIITQDWQRLADFYVQVFACEVVPPERDQSGDWLERGTGVPNAHLRGVHLRLPGYGEHGPTLEVYQYADNLQAPSSLSNRVGFRHIAFEVEDVRAVCAQVVAHGGTAYGEIIETSVAGKGALTFAYVKDPDGNLIEIQRWG